MVLGFQTQRHVDVRSIDIKATNLVPRLRDLQKAELRELEATMFLFGLIHYIFVLLPLFFFIVEPFLVSRFPNFAASSSLAFCNMAPMGALIPFVTDALPNI